jgi:hypothetical protein
LHHDGRPTRQSPPDAAHEFTGSQFDRKPAGVNRRTPMSAFPSTAGIRQGDGDVRFVPILLQKSKIEQP